MLRLPSPKKDQEMDLKAYFADLRATQAKLDQKAEDGVVYVTSVFHRERNSTPGQTLSASTENAARVITDGTHREATVEEVAAFHQRQREELERTTKSEQLKKKQYIVVVDQHQPSEAAFMPQVVSKSVPQGKGTEDKK